LSKGSVVTIDPRTLREIKRFADCHLIPDCFNVSNKTVRLDGEFDNLLGTQCDAQLRRLIEIEWGNVLTGKASLGGGSKSHSAVLLADTGQLLLPKPKRGTIKDWAMRALGLQSAPEPGVVSKLQFEGWVGDVADNAKAYLSIINSAILVLYDQDRQRAFDPVLDGARALLSKVGPKAVENSDWEILKNMIELGAFMDAKKVAGQEFTFATKRKFYDPNLDPGDGVFDNFPTKCITQVGDAIVVTLPYSRSLRARVTFRAVLGRGT
jgi:hypothetical protein